MRTQVPAQCLGVVPYILDLLFYCLCAAAQATYMQLYIQDDRTLLFVSSAGDAGLEEDEFDQLEAALMQGDDDADTGGLACWGSCAYCSSDSASACKCRWCWCRGPG